MCVLSDALNVASQWCGAGPVSERWVQRMPLVSLCCAHVCAAMRKSPVVVLGNFKAPEGSAVRQFRHPLLPLKRSSGWGRVFKKTVASGGARVSRRA